MTTPTSEKSGTDLHGPNLILDVENFGPIAEAKNIEFKPMTVFVGKSNTGKTYLAMLFNSLLKARQATKSGPSFWGDESKGDTHIFDDDRYDEFLDDVYPWIEGVFEDPEARGADVWFDIDVADFGKAAQSLLRVATSRYLTSYAHKANEAIAGYFDVKDLAALTNRNSINSHTTTISILDPSSNLEVLVQDSEIGNFDPPKVMAMSIDVSHEVGSPQHAATEYLQNMDFRLERYVESSLDHFPSVHYFRAGRTGLIDAYRELAATLINRATSESRRDRVVNQLAVRIATSEFLQSIVRIRPNSKPWIQSTKIRHLSDVLEDSVLGGKITVKETAGITYFEFKKDGLVIPLDSASSMVTELAPIVLFIRAFVSDGDLLIIDEPEAHLHPDAQQQMAAALAFMVRSGLRVLITTHSHYMVEQLSAFVNASKLDETTRKRALSLGGALGEEDIYLNEDETAVYSFKMSPEHGGSVVEEIFMGEEYEYGPDDHSDATTKQFNRLQSVLEAREAIEFDDLD